ncbi:MAG: MBL fold metallo-hydrolase [Methanospirillum sp.]|nr:MBL fold metallo-hydrolase [Methanospirillum sp.]
MDVQRLRLAVIPLALILMTTLSGACLAADHTATANITETTDPENGVVADSTNSAARNGTAGCVVTGSAADGCRTRLVLLGTTGGVGWWPETDRASSSAAIVVNDTIYVVDMGQGSAPRLSQAFNTGTFIETSGGRIQDGSSTFLQNMTALFFTHLHMDHTADYPALLLTGPGAGLGMRTDAATNRTTFVPLKVFGPCTRGQLEEDRVGFTNRGGRIVSTDSADPEQITTSPGTRQMTEVIWQAYAQAINDLTLDDGYPDFRSLVNVTEIGGNASWDIPMPVTVTDPNNGTCPAMDPFEVYRDSNVRVTAVLVDHHQIYPAFAFRFDTQDGSVVFSGDTGPDTGGNLQRLATGADILVHEVIDRAWIDQKFGAPAPGSPMDALKTHMLESHTANDVVGSVAESCGVGTLVLNHIVPGNTPPIHLLEAARTFTGQVIVGEDLMQIGIGATG